MVGPVVVVVVLVVVVIPLFPGNHSTAAVIPPTTIRATNIGAMIVRVILESYCFMVFTSDLSTHRCNNRLRFEQLVQSIEHLVLLRVDM